MAVFCTLRCAATAAVEPYVAGAKTWCARHQEWETEDDAEICKRDQQEDRASIDPSMI